MTYHGTEIDVNYIYGACTLPSERGQGLMRQLIQKAFEVMKNRRVALTVIIPAAPWLFDYYRDLGYTEVFDYSEETYIRSYETVREQNVLIVPSEVLSTKSLYNFLIKNSGNVPVMYCMITIISSPSCVTCRSPADKCWQP